MVHEETLILIQNCNISPGIAGLEKNPVKVGGVGLFAPENEGDRLAVRISTLTSKVPLAARE